MKDQEKDFMKYQKRYKPKTKFEKFRKIYFIIGILIIAITGTYAAIKSIQRKKEVASETIIHTVAVPKISLKKQNGLEENDLFVVSLHQLKVRKNIT